MSFVEVLLPVFVQVILTFVVAFVLGYRRYGAVRAGELRGKITLREPNWPPYTRQAEYNYLNQFELPVLFYVLMILLLITRKADYIMVMLAWIFVALRIVHAFVHLTTNKIELRGPIFFVGALVLIIMWGLFIVDVIRVS
jgi:hypothetical protein